MNMPPGERSVHSKTPDPFDAESAAEEHAEGEMVVLDLTNEDFTFAEKLFKEHRQLEEDFKAIDAMNKAMLSNLTSVQARCTELELARREATRMMKEAVDESITHMKRYLAALSRAERAERELVELKGRMLRDVGR